MRRARKPDQFDGARFAAVHNLNPHMDFWAEGEWLYYPDALGDNPDLPVLLPAWTIEYVLDDQPDPDLAPSETVKRRRLRKQLRPTELEALRVRLGAKRIRQFDASVER